MITKQAHLKMMMHGAKYLQRAGAGGCVCGVLLSSKRKQQQEKRDDKRDDSAVVISDAIPLFHSYSSPLAPFTEAALEMIDDHCEQQQTTTKRDQQQQQQQWISGMYVHCVSSFAVPQSIRKLAEKIATMTTKTTSATAAATTTEEERKEDDGEGGNRINKTKGEAMTMIEIRHVDCGELWPSLPDGVMIVEDQKETKPTTTTQPNKEIIQTLIDFEESLDNPSKSSSSWLTQHFTL